MWRRRMEEELERDIAEHLALETEENIARGMRPRDARDAARRKFGNIGRIKEETRGVWVWQPLESLLADGKQALRGMRRAPGTTALAVLSLAIAFAPSVTMFSIMDRLFLTPVPVRAPAELLMLGLMDRRPNVDRPFHSLAYSEFREFRGSLRSFSGLAFQRRQGALVTLNGRRSIVWANLVSDGYFDVLGIPLQQGRGLSGDRPGAVVSHNLWLREFDGRPDILGRTLLVNGQAFVIEGIAARGFRGVEKVTPADLWIPVETWLQVQPGWRAVIENSDGDCSVFGRVRQGLAAQAQAEIAAAGRALAQHRPVANRHLQGYAYDGLSGRGGIVLTGIGVLVLGILLAVACANVAGILLAKAEERRHETAIRQALGASRGRLIRAWMVEGSVLSVSGAAVGLAGARALMNFLPRLLPAMPVPLTFEFSTGVRVWAYAAGLMLVSALSFAIVPAWRASRADLLSGLRRDFSVSVLRVRVPVRGALIVAQVAAAELLLFSAGLIFETLSAARHIDPGFDPGRPVVMAMLVPAAEDGSRREIDWESLRTRLAAIPGVRRAAYGQSVPLSGTQGPKLRLELPGQEPSEILGGSAGPGFFTTFGVRMVAGRDLRDSDRRGVLVNAALARRLPNAVGRQIRLDGAIREIVGVFQDLPWASPGEPVRPRAIALAPARAGGETTVALEVDGNTEAFLGTLRSTLARETGAIVLTPKTLRRHYEDALFVERTATQALYGLGLLALLLTATGLHGIAGALFARRSKEFAIRLTLGAPPRHLVATVLGNALKLTAAGLVLGLGVAMPAALVLASKVYTLRPWSAPALCVSSAIVIAAALAAAAQPAWRVLRIAPAEIVRAE